jgi:hypothetical protein
MSECKPNIKNKSERLVNFLQARRLYFISLIPFFVPAQAIINSTIIQKGKLILNSIYSNVYGFVLQNNTDIWFLCKNNLSN